MYQLVVATSGATFDEAVQRARAVALTAFVDADGAVTPFQQVSAALKTRAADGGTRFVGSVTFTAVEAFGVQVVGDEVKVNLPGVDTGGLTVGGAPIDKLDEVPVVDPPIEMGKM